MRWLKEKSWPVAFKIALIAILMVAVTVIIVTTLTLRREQESFEFEIRQQATLLLGALRGALRDDLYSLDADALQDTMEGMGTAQILTFGRVYDGDGHILADLADNTLRLSVVPDPFGQRLLASNAIVFEQQPDQLVAGQAIILGQERIGAISIGLPTASLKARLVSIRNQSIVVAFLMLVASIVVAVILSRSITRPIDALIVATDHFSQGDFTRKVPVQSKDELGKLAAAFNSMTDHLQRLVEQLNRRNLAMDTTIAVSQQITAFLDEKALVANVVQHVQNAFDYYHVHIYLLNDMGKTLIMAGGTGDVGQKMLAHGHRMPISRGMVGRAARTNTSGFAPDTTQEEAWQPNPLLPDTRSEIAVPIALGDEVLGVLDVQHNALGGLKPDDVQVLEAIASQTAIALRNARIYAASQRQAQQETRLNEINQKIDAARSVEEVMQITVRELGQFLGADKTVIRLLDNSHETITES